MLSEGIWNFGHPARLGRSRDVIFLFFGIVGKRSLCVAPRLWGRKEGRKGGEQLAPGGEGKWERVWQRPFSPLARTPAGSFGCFPCLHSKRRLAKKICTSYAAGGAVRAGPSLLAHCRRRTAAHAARHVQNFFASHLMLCRHGRQPSEREGGRGGGRGLPAPPPFLPSP